MRNRPAVYRRWRAIIRARRVMVRLAALAALSGCSYIALEDNGVKVTRIAVGTSLQIQSLAVGTDGEGRRQVVVHGAGSEQQNVTEAIARGVASGLK